MSDNKFLRCPKCNNFDTWQLYTEYEVTRQVKYRRKVYVYVGDDKWNSGQAEEDEQQNMSRWRTSKAHKVKVTFDRDYSETVTESGSVRDQQAIAMSCGHCGWDADTDFIDQVTLVDIT